MNSLHQSALDFIDLGFGVFPLNPKEKTPMACYCPHGFKDATKDKELAATWWRKAPSANLGLVTGHGHFVLDVDGECAEAALRYICRQQGELPRTLSVRTGRGKHLYFRSDAVIPCSTGKLAPGLDIKGSGGYVVGPPSIHPSGAKYEIIDSAPVADAPQWLVETVLLLQQEPERSPRPEAPRLNGPAATDRDRAYAEAALRAECEAVAGTGEGSRNVRLNEASLKLGQLVAGGLISEPEVRASLENAARQCGLPLREARATIASGLRGGGKQPRGRPRSAGAEATGEIVARPTSHNGNGVQDAGDGRPTIQLSSDLHADLLACERELISSNFAEVYQRAGRIVRRGTGKGKAHTGETVVFDRITHHNPNSLRTVLAKTIVFEGWNEKKKKFVLRHPPKDYAGCLLDHPDKNYPILHGLISAPTLRADGSILDVSGYDERSGLYFDPKGADFRTIPINPTRGDALAALKELDEPIAKFPFVDEASKSVQLARMLTGIVRTALMTSPMFAYTAPTPRTGKSLLVDIACILSHGHVAPVIVASSTFEERDKQLQAALAGGDT